MGHSLHNIGYAYQAQKEYAKALQYFRRARSILTKALGPHHPFVVRTLDSIGNMYREKEDYTTALEYLRIALQSCEKGLSPEHPLLVATLLAFGVSLADQGHAHAAIGTFKRLVAICNTKQCAPAIHGRGLMGLVKALVETKQDKEFAISLARKAQQVFSKTHQVFEEDLKDLHAWLEKNEKRITSISSRRRF